MKYKKIACSLYDQLLALATERTIVEIKHLTHNKKETITRTQIHDVLTRNGEEFLVLDKNVELRLDYIISIDGVTFKADFCGLP